MLLLPPLVPDRLVEVWNLRPGRSTLLNNGQHTSIALFLKLLESSRVQEVPTTQAAKEARLRRLCERKPTGRLHCPEWLHTMWKNPANRTDMVDKLEANGWNKD